MFCTRSVDALDMSEHGPPVRQRCVDTHTRVALRAQSSANFTARKNTMAHRNHPTLFARANKRFEGTPLAGPCAGIFVLLAGGAARLTLARPRARFDRLGFRPSRTAAHGLGSCADALASLCRSWLCCSGMSKVHAVFANCAHSSLTRPRGASTASGAPVLFGDSNAWFRSTSAYGSGNAVRRCRTCASASDATADAARRRERQPAPERSASATELARQGERGESAAPAEAAAYLRCSFESPCVAQFVCDPDGRVLASNHRFQAVFGSARPGIVDMSALCVEPTSSSESWESSRSATSRTFASSICAPGDATQECLVTLWAERAGDDAILRVHGSLLDRKARARLEELPASAGSSIRLANRRRAGARLQQPPDHHSLNQPAHADER